MKKVSVSGYRRKAYRRKTGEWVKATFVKRHERYLKNMDKKIEAQEKKTRYEKLLEEAALSRASSDYERAKAELERAKARKYNVEAVTILRGSKKPKDLSFLTKTTPAYFGGIEGGAVGGGKEKVNKKKKDKEEKVMSRKNSPSKYWGASHFEDVPVERSKRRPFGF